MTKKKSIDRFYDRAEPNLTAYELQLEASRGDGAYYTEEEALDVGAMGIAEEADEVAGVIELHLVVPPREGLLAPMLEVDRSDLAKELSDVLWYATLIAHHCGMTLLDISEAEGIAARIQQDGAIDLTRWSTRIEKAPWAGLRLCRCAGKVTGLIKKRFHHAKPFASETMRAALAEVVVAIAFVGRFADLTLQNVMDVGIAKSRARYPSGFNKADASAVSG